ncbi:hypothetical protein A3K70_03360 [Candidatus Bathyarchaeota archaeon RBG_16_48_13]|nr:MAG: hypothetical protein A3K70_03360 [Candidatus Bathyarchaeota archaeon RBG_16_48_13]
MAQKMHCEFVSWDEIYSMCKELAKTVECSGYEPNTLVALARSGFIPGRLLSDFMGITDLVSLKVEHWLDTTGQHKDEATIPYMIPLNLDGKRVLVVDDIVDTGKSMVVSVDYIKRYKPAAIKTAVMHYINSSMHKPDYYVRFIADWTWFVWPWNRVEDLCNLFQRLLKTDLKRAWSARDIREGIMKSFDLTVSKEQVNEVLNTLSRRNKVEKKIENDRELWMIRS